MARSAQKSLNMTYDLTERHVEDLDTTLDITHINKMTVLYPPLA